MRAEVLGPVFSKVYTPNNFLADRLKHVIEPSFACSAPPRSTAKSRCRRWAAPYDRVVGGVTRMTYGLTNRVLVRKAPTKGSASPLASRAPAIC